MGRHTDQTRMNETHPCKEPGKSETLQNPAGFSCRHPFEFDDYCRVMQGFGATPQNSLLYVIFLFIFLLFSNFTPFTLKTLH